MSGLRATNTGSTVKPGAIFGCPPGCTKTSCFSPVFWLIMGTHKVVPPRLVKANRKIGWLSVPVASDEVELVEAGALMAMFILEQS